MGDGEGRQGEGRGFREYELTTNRGRNAHQSLLRQRRTRSLKDQPAELGVAGQSIVDYLVLGQIRAEECLGE